MSKKQFSNKLNYVINKIESVIEQKGNKTKALISLYIDAGNYCKILKDYNKAIIFYLKGVDVAILFKGELRWLSALYYNLSYAYFNVNEHNTACGYLEKFIAIDEINLNASDLVQSYLMGAALYEDYLNDYSVALQFRLKSLQIEESLYTTPHQQIQFINYYNLIGIDYYFLEKYDMSILYFEKGINVCVHNFTKCIDVYITCCINMAWSYFYLKNYDKASQYKNEAYFHHNTYGYSQKEKLEELDSFLVQHCR